MHTLAWPKRAFTLPFISRMMTLRDGAGANLCPPDGHQRTPSGSTSLQLGGDYEVSDDVKVNISALTAENYKKTWAVVAPNDFKEHDEVR